MEEYLKGEHYLVGTCKTCGKFACKNHLFDKSMYIRHLTTEINNLKKLRKRVYNNSYIYRHILLDLDIFKSVIKANNYELDIHYSELFEKYKAIVTTPRGSIEYDYNNKLQKVLISESEDKQIKQKYPELFL